jgi:L-seryl-tRNA(Ser) seleniumtransferase
MIDLGSGMFVDRATQQSWGLPDEPTVAESVASGADLVTFSGDKLLGGPQAGIIAGTADVVSRCARHPLARALRPGAHVLAALQATALAYLRGDGMAIPFWRMASASVDELRARAEAIGGGAVVASEAVPGGGSAPGVTIPSIAIALDGDRTAALRALDPPVIARVDGDRTLLDLRSVDPGDDPVLAKAIAAVV